MKTKSLNIGMLVPDINSYYYAAIVKGVADNLKAHNHNLILSSSFDDPKLEKSSIKSFIANKCDGVIVISIMMMKKDLDYLKDNGIKVVVCDNKLDGHYPSVINDNYSGAYQLFDYMVQKGCSRIGWIGGNPLSFVVKERLRAYKDVLAKYKLPYLQDIFIFGERTLDFGYENAPKLLDHKYLDGVFGVNDSVALGIYKYCCEKGIKIPDNLKLTGFDDLEISSLTKVPLTTVRQYKEFLGKKASDLLIREIYDPQDPMVIVLDPALMPRTSC